MVHGIWWCNGRSSQIHIRRISKKVLSKLKTVFEFRRLHDKAPIDFVWSSLPIASSIINPEDIITEANPAAEGFFNASGKSLCRQIYLGTVGGWSAFGKLCSRKEFATPLFVNDVEVGSFGTSQLPV